MSLQELTYERVYFSYRTIEIKQKPTLQKTDWKKLNQIYQNEIKSFIILAWLRRSV